MGWGIRLSNFGGIAPAINPRLLPPNFAQVAKYLKLRYGSLKPLLGDGTEVYDPAGASIQSIFLYRGTGSPLWR